jgi:ABC-type polysaccharide/polyol phosphate export permease
MSKSFKTLIKYDFIVFFREPFYALGGMFLPSVVFAFLTMMGIMPASRAMPFYSMLIAFMVFFFNIGLQYLMDKESGVHKRLILSSINKNHIVYASFIRGGLLSILGLAQIFLISVIGSGMHVPAHFPLFLLAYVVFITILFLLSISIYDLLKSTKQALPFTIFMMQYVFVCSGALFPIEMSPEYLKPVIYLNPFYHMHQMLLSIWQWELGNISFFNVSYIVVLTVVCLGIARYNNTRREK